MIILQPQELLRFVKRLVLVCFGLHKRFLKLSESPQNKQVSLRQSELPIRLVAHEDVIEVRDALEISGCLPQVDIDSGESERRSHVRILALDDADVGDDREGVLFVNERVGRPPEDDVRDETRFFVGASMLPDRHCYSKVVIW